MPLKDLDPVSKPATATETEPIVAATGHTEITYPPDPGEPVAPVVAAPLPPSREPTQWVKVLGDQVGQFEKGAFVPASAFPYIARLLPKSAMNPDGLGVLEYVNDTDVDAAQVVQPLSTPPAYTDGAPPSARIPPAPWANASPADILGVASEVKPS